MYQIQVYNAQRAARMLIDLTHRCTQATARRDLRGDSTATIAARVPNQTAYQLYDLQGMGRVDVYDDGALIWRGRLDDVTLTPDGVALGAFGYQQSLRDLRYTALWSDTSTARWAQTTQADASTSYNDRFELDNNNRLRMGARAGETYGNTTLTKRAYWRYRIPDGSSRQITRIAWTYTLTGIDTAWTIGLFNNDRSAVIWGTIASIAGTVGPTAITQTFTGQDSIWALLGRNAADAAYGGVTGSTEAIFTSPRVTTATPPITANLIIADLISAVSTANPDLLSSVTGLVGNPGIDLTDAIYEDAVPSDILDTLAVRGDTSGDVWRWWVDRNQTLHFARMPQWFDGTSQIYAVDVSSLEASRSTRAVRNRIIARYQDANGRTLRTAAANNTSSQRRYGVILQDVTDADTTSSSTAATIRDTALADAALPTPRAAVRTDRLYAFNGTRVPLSRVEPGDFVVLRNILPGFVSDANALRTMQVSEVELDLINGGVTITPLVPIPTLDRLIAEQGA